MSEPHAHDSHDDHGFSHAMPASMLIGVFVALIVLTVVTVLLAGSPLIPPGYDIIVAMIIASVKASLVVLIFMHVLFDKPLNAILFVFSLVFVALFLGFALSDTEQYQHRIKNYSDDVSAPM